MMSSDADSVEGLIGEIAGLANRPAGWVAWPSMFDEKLRVVVLEEMQGRPVMPVMRRLRVRLSDASRQADELEVVGHHRFESGREAVIEVDAGFPSEHHPALQYLIAIIEPDVG